MSLLVTQWIELTESFALLQLRNNTVDASWELLWREPFWRQSPCKHISSVPLNDTGDIVENKLRHTATPTIRFGKRWFSGISCAVFNNIHDYKRTVNFARMTIKSNIVCKNTLLWCLIGEKHSTHTEIPISALAINHLCIRYCISSSGHSLKTVSHENMNPHPHLIQNKM